MVAITGIVLLAILAGLFFLFRAMGSMGQKPTAHERMRHNATKATGLDRVPTAWTSYFARRRSRDEVGQVALIGCSGCAGIR